MLLHIMNTIHHFMKLEFVRLLRFLNVYKLTRYHRDETIRDRDYYTVIEYPKCGRTWLRYMLNQALAIKTGVPLMNIMHDVPYRKSILRLPYIYYVHGMDPEKSIEGCHYQKLFKNELCPFGFILLVRKPENVMKSYYYQILYRQSNVSFRGDLSDFIRSENFGIKKYVDYVDFYLKALARKNCLVVRYEDMAADTCHGLREILNFIKMPIDDEQIASIVANSTADKMREVEEKDFYKVGWLRTRDANNPQSRKVRSCGGESVEEMFSPDDLRYMREVYEKNKSFQLLGYV